MFKKEQSVTKHQTGVSQENVWNTIHDYWSKRSACAGSLNKAGFFSLPVYLQICIIVRLWNFALAPKYWIPNESGDIILGFGYLKFVLRLVKMTEFDPKFSLGSIENFIR